MIQVSVTRRVTLAEDVSNFQACCEKFEEDPTFENALEPCRMSRKAWARYYSNYFSYSWPYVMQHKDALEKSLKLVLKLLQKHSDLAKNQRSYEYGRLKRHIEYRLEWVGLLHTRDGVALVEASMAKAERVLGRFQRDAA